MSKKKTTKQQKRKQKKAQRRKKRQAHRPVARTSQSGQQVLSDWAEDLRENEMFDKAQFVINPTDEDKMSEALLDIVGELADGAETQGEMERLLMLGVTAWNATLLDSEVRQSFLDDALTSLGIVDEMREDLLFFITDMMETKRLLHPTNHRYILNAKVVDRGDHFYVSVAATIPSPK